MFSYVSTQMREIVIEMSCPRSCRCELNLALQTAMQILQPYLYPSPPTALIFSLVLADEHQNVFQGVTLSRALSVCLCERDRDSWGGVAASTFNFHLSIFPNYSDISWLPVRVLKSLIKNLRKEAPVVRIHLYEKWSSMTKNLVFLFLSLSYYCCPLQKVLYSVPVEIAGSHAMLMVISFFLS